MVGTNQLVREPAVDNPGGFCLDVYYAETLTLCSSAKGRECPFVFHKVYPIAGAILRLYGPLSSTFDAMAELLRAALDADLLKAEELWERQLVEAKLVAFGVTWDNNHIV